MEQTKMINAIVLDKQPWGERDAKVVLYSREFGRMEAIARGSRALLSKLNGQLEIFNSIEAMIILGRRHDYIGGAVAKNIYSNLTSDLDRVLAAGRLLSKLQQAVWPEEADPKLYDWLEQWLSAVNQADRAFNHWPAMVQAGEIRLLSDLGFAVDNERCQVCAADFLNEAWQKPSGELICDRCRRQVQDDYLELNRDLLANIKIIYTQKPENWLESINWTCTSLKTWKSIVTRLSFYRA